MISPISTFLILGGFLGGLYIVVRLIEQETERLKNTRNTRKR